MKIGSWREPTEFPGPRLSIVTGPRGSGKSTWCTAHVEAMRGQGLHVDGVICPAVFLGSVKIAIDAITLGDGTRRTLAVSGSGNESGSRARGRFGFGALAWDFDPLVTGEVEAYLGGLDNVAHLVIDEIGPLELFRGGGWQTGLRLLDGRGYETAAVVVRSSLLDTAIRRWPWADVVVLGMEEAYACV